MAHALLNERTPSVSERWVVGTEDGRVVWIVGERVGIFQENATAIHVQLPLFHATIYSSGSDQKESQDSIQAIHSGRGVPPVAIDYRSGFQFLLLSVSNLSVFSTTSAWPTPATA